MTMNEIKGLASLLFAVSLVDCGGEGVTTLAQQSEREKEQTSVWCNSEYGNGRSGQLVDPPAACTRIFSSCTDDRIYHIDCNGLGCVCSVDGSADRRMLNDDTFLSPHCPDMVETATRCGWPLVDPPTSSSGGQSLQGMPCEDGINFDDTCECRDGQWRCPGADGCSPVGKHRPMGEELPVIEFLPNGTFFVAEVTAAATFEDVTNDRASGFFGTWVYSGDTLALRSYHSPYNDTCIWEAGRYRATFDESCELTELELLEDDCKPRHEIAMSAFEAG